MRVDLLPHLRALGFEPLYPKTYIGRGGNVPMVTAVTQEIVIGNNDFCVTDLWVLMKDAGGGEGGDLTIRNLTTDYDYSNVPAPMDTGIGDRPNVPLQTVPGMPSMFELPFILNAGDRIEITAYSRFVAHDYFDVVLNGYVLNTVRAPIPYLPKWYHFNGAIADIAATTFSVQQEVTIAGPSDFLCWCISSNWELGAAAVDIRETIVNQSDGHSYTKKLILHGGCFPRPYDTVAEVAFPVPFKIRNGSVLMRDMSNWGVGAARRPELTVFGYFDLRGKE